MYIPDTHFNINNLNGIKNLINNPQEINILIIFISYLIFLSSFIIILLLYDINKYNKYLKLINKIYSKRKKNDDYQF